MIYAIGIAIVGTSFGFSVALTLDLIRHNCRYGFNAALSGFQFFLLVGTIAHWWIK